MKIPNLKKEQLIEHLERNEIQLTELILKSIDFATIFHKHQKRDDGSSYLEQHIYPITLDVAEQTLLLPSLNPENAISGAFLHDSLEDVEELKDEYFIHLFGKAVYDVVKPLTKQDYHKFPGETKYDKKMVLNKVYFKALEKARLESKIIKLADRLNNIVVTHPQTTKPEKIKFYIKETERFYIPFAKENSNFFYKKISEELKKLKNRTM